MNPKTKKLAVMAMLVALSVVMVSLVHFPIFPAAAFLEYDPADIPILLGALLYGPLAGILLTVVASLIQGFTVSAGAGLYGILMHIIATSVLVLVASGLYRWKRTTAASIVGLVLGTLAMGGVMMVANHFITPYFMGVPVQVVDAMLLPVILPFNLLKAGINALLTFLVYKAIARFITENKPKSKQIKNESVPDLEAKSSSLDEPETMTQAEA